MGKKSLQWTRTPREALAMMIELNNRCALDGRDPNSVSGIFWVLGRYDRPWAPRRDVFGVVRYMSSERTVCKLRMKRYLATYGPASSEVARTAVSPSSCQWTRASPMRRKLMAGVTGTASPSITLCDTRTSVLTCAAYACTACAR